jgi:hypothetical protein
VVGRYVSYKYKSKGTPAVALRESDRSVAVPSWKQLPCYILISLRKKRVFMLGAP